MSLLSRLVMLGLCWLCCIRVTALPVVEADWTMSLEFALPTPVPLHQFTQSPIVVEVKNRNPEYEH
jgi:hypothetical protein